MIVIQRAETELYLSVAAGVTLRERAGASTFDDGNEAAAKVASAVAAGVIPPGRYVAVKDRDYDLARPGDADALWATVTAGHAYAKAMALEAKFPGVLNAT